MARAKAKIIPEKIHIAHINVIHCHISTGNEYLNNPVKWDKIGISIRKEDAYSFENRGCRFRLYFKCVALKNSIELDLTADIGIEYYFKVENFGDFIVKDGDQNIIDIQLGSTLLAIAFSTSRGIILEKTQNTYFRGIILPIVDPNSVLLEEQEN